MAIISSSIGISSLGMHGPNGGMALAQQSSNATQLAQVPSTEAKISFAQVFVNSEPSVVQVTSSSPTSSDPLATSLGSGFVYDTSGHIITNYHVISGQSGIVHITFTDGTVYNAKVAASDPYSDIAVLQVQNISSSKLVPLQLANSSQLVVGEPVAAIGNPYGLSGSMSEGIVSGLHRVIPEQSQAQNQSFFDQSSPPSYMIPDNIQTDAAINPGNSGGPLLDGAGKVVGMNTAIYSTSGAFQGVGFALASNTISRVVQQLFATGNYQHPWVGVSGMDMTPELAAALGLKDPRGFLVEGVTSGSPAAAAGIKGSHASGGSQPLASGSANSLPTGGDLILGIDNQKVSKLDDLLTYL